MGKNQKGEDIEINEKHCRTQLNSHICKLAKNGSKQETWRGNIQKWIKHLVTLWNMQEGNADYDTTLKYIEKQLTDKSKVYEKGGYDSLPVDKLKAPYRLNKIWFLKELKSAIEESKKKWK